MRLQSASFGVRSGKSLFVRHHLSSPMSARISGMKWSLSSYTCECRKFWSVMREEEYKDEPRMC